MTRGFLIHKSASLQILQNTIFLMVRKQQHSLITEQVRQSPQISENILIKVVNSIHDEINQVTFANSEDCVSYD